MATDPSALIQQLLSPQGVNGFQQAYQAGQDRQLAQAQAQQQLQAGSMQLQQAQAQQAQQQQYSQDVAAWQRDGSRPEGLVALATKYPQWGKELQDARKFQTDEERQSNQTFYANVWNAAKNGNTDLVIKLLTDRKTALLNSKQVDQASSVDDALQQLQEDPTKGLSNVQSYALSQMYGTDPAQFAKVFGIGGDKDSTHVINPGGALVDNTGRELYRATDKPERPVEVPIYDDSGRRIGTQLVPLGGGDHASGAQGSAGATGRTTGGWTPRISNGGDNSDAAVDGKIAGASKFLGLDPTASLAGIPPMKIAQAMALSEGGAGTLADKNNNPANLRNTDGSYKSFPSKQAGLAAAAALVQRKIANGQNTVQTLVEGLPAGGSASSTPGYFGPQGGTGGAANIKAGDISTVPAPLRASVQAIADGRSTPPRPGSRNGEALLDAVTAFDPTFDASNAQSRVKTRVDFTSGKSAQSITAMNTAIGHLLHLDDEAHDLGNFSTLPGVLNPAYNAIRRKVGNNTNLPAFEQTKQAAASELRKVFAGASGGNLEELRQFEDNLNSSQSYDQIHRVIRNSVELLGSRLSALQDQYAQGMNRSDQIPTFIKPSLARQTQQRFGVDLGSGGKSTAPSAPPAVSAPPQAIAYLKANPSLAAAFDHKYGAGTAASILGK